MAKLNLGRTVVQYPGEEVYVIAEIGQNHQGDLKIAKKMIYEAKRAGCNCVKFQKSNLNEKFTKSALDRPYNSTNSWGSTYGKHKEFLEFSIEEFKYLQNYCNSLEIDFTASCMDELSLQELYSLNVPFIKIGSGDTNNFPLISAASKLPNPLVISTGMQTNATIEEVVAIMQRANKTNFAMLHCVSSYPTIFKDCNLNMISIMLKKYPNILIGYSGHECGIEVSKAAALLGARIIERHFTLDKTQKGSDHFCSLEPSEFADLVHQLKQMKNERYFKKAHTKQQVLEYFAHKKEIAEALSMESEKHILKCEMNCRNKLGKSLVAKENLYKCRIITANDIKVKVSEPNGIPAEDYNFVIGKELKVDISKDSPLDYNDLLI